jgi:RHS repeat-associated protein
MMSMNGPGGGWEEEPPQTTLNPWTTERYEYTPYGVRTVLDANFVPVAGNTSAIGWVYGFQGGRHDLALGGSGWVEFRNRWLVTDQGRWNRQDPAGFVDGSNLYQHVRSSPVRFVDPMGLMGQGGQSSYGPPDSIGGPWTWTPDPTNPRGGTFRNAQGHQASFDYQYSHWDVDDGSPQRKRYDVRGNPLTVQQAHNPPRRMLPINPRTLGALLAASTALISSGMTSGASINGFICDPNCRAWFVTLVSSIRRARAGVRVDPEITIGSNYSKCLAALPAILGDAGAGSVGVLSSQRAIEAYARAVRDHLLAWNDANGY